MKKFSIEEIRNYIRSQDSLGDVLYFLSEEKIIEANQKPEEENNSPENCKHYDECQGRHKCCSPDVEDHQCWGVCEFYDEEI